jgi:hypothetical protein
VVRYSERHFAIVIVNCALRLSRTGVPESVTVMVNFDVPARVGLPLITPVALSRRRPRGSDPAVTDQVYGVVPPVADSGLDQFGGVSAAGVGHGGGVAVGGTGAPLEGVGGVGPAGGDHAVQGRGGGGYAAPGSGDPRRALRRLLIGGNGQAVQEPGDDGSHDRVEFDREDLRVGADVESDRLSVVRRTRHHLVEVADREAQGVPVIRW